jgi:AhpD family alkylhydroperoxidase
MPTTRKKTNLSPSELRAFENEYLSTLGFVPKWFDFISETSPVTLEGYETIRKVVYSEGALSKKMKQLLLVAMNLICRNDQGARLHIKIATKFGASRDELAETVATTAMLGAALPMSKFGNIVDEIPKVQRRRRPGMTERSRS